MAEYRRILVVDLLGGLGDLIMVLPAVHALALRHRSARLRVLTHAPGSTLLAADPHVDCTVVAPRGAEAAVVAAQLTRWDPHLVVSTTRHSGIDRIVEEHGSRAVTDLWRSPPTDVPVSSRYLEILRTERLIGAADPPGQVHVTVSEMDRARSVLRAGRPTLLVPGAGMSVKRWPAEHWAELARALPGPVVHITEHGQSLRELAALFTVAGQRQGVVVGADTGPVRLAAVVGCRTVALFGPTWAPRYGLTSSTAVNLQGLPDCSHRRPLAITEQRCWWHADCPLDSTRPACMAAIQVSEVLSAILG